MAASHPLDATPAVLAAIRTTLLADATLAPMLVGEKVMVRAPSSAPTPYIETDPSDTDYSTASEDGQDVRVDLHVWHQPASKTPETGTTMAIMGHVRRLLHTASLTLDAPFNCVLCWVINRVGPYHDPDGATIHGVVTVRVIVDHV